MLIQWKWTLKVAESVMISLAKARWQPRASANRQNQVAAAELDDIHTGIESLKVALCLPSIAIYSWGILGWSPLGWLNPQWTFQTHPWEGTGSDGVSGRWGSWRRCSLSEIALASDMGMDQYLLIPFLGGWTSIYQLFWCSPAVQGFDTLPYLVTSICLLANFLVSLLDLDLALEACAGPRTQWSWEPKYPLVRPEWSWTIPSINPMWITCMNMQDERSEVRLFIAILVSVPGVLFGSVIYIYVYVYVYVYICIYVYGYGTIDTKFHRTWFAQHCYLVKTPGRAKDSLRKRWRQVPWL